MSAEDFGKEYIMNFSFHYYGTYCAAREAGLNSDDSWKIAHAAQFVDECTKGLLKAYKKSHACPTCHTNTELFDMNKGKLDSPFPDEIPQVWTSFHFLPGNFTEDGHYRLPYRNKDFISDPTQMELFKLTCLPYSHMVGKIVDAAKREFLSADNSPDKKLCYIGMVMHVLADTFSHEYFVGTPSEAINEASWITEFSRSEEITPYRFSNIKTFEEKTRPFYSYSPALSSTSVGWLGHGRCGKYPDIPDKKYFYNPNWYPDAVCIKNNPILHLCAFVQMTNAMKFIIDAENDQPFDYARELTSEEYHAQYSSKLMEIFTSDGSDHNQNEKWSQHILDTYSQPPVDHNVKLLASDKNFLDGFTESADKHMKMVCQYCSSITSSISFFDI